MISNRIKFLDGIRFLLALWVVIGHFYTLVGGVKLYRFNRFIEEILTHPIIAVYGFMIITGFLMMHNYMLRENKEPVDDKNTFIKFWLRRFFRLYPLYIALIAVAFVSFTPIALLAEKDLVFFTGSNISVWGTPRSTVQPGITDLVSHIFLIHGFIPKFEDSILGVTWSLSLEMQFYFIFPFIFLWFFKNERIIKWRLIILLIVSTLISVILPKLLTPLFLRNHLPNFREPSVILYIMPLFLLGMIMAGVKSKRIKVLYLIISLFLVIIFVPLIAKILIGILLLFFFLDEIQTVVPRFIFKFLSAIDSLLSSRLAESGANISYSLYLVHTMVIPVVLHIVISNAKSLGFSKAAIIFTSLILVLISCAGICYLLYRFVEKPFINLGKKIIGKAKAH